MKPLESPLPWSLHEMRTCFTIRDANGWSVAQITFGYTNRLKEAKRRDAQLIVDTVNATQQLTMTEKLQQALFEEDGDD